ncbi:MAG: sigma-70 family RNA polymerase sigma factor [Gaiellaceae bacterium]
MNATPARGAAADAESALVAAAKRGDERAFERLTAPYRREIHVHCYRMLGSFTDAEDLVQETLLRAWRALPRFEERASFRAWLYKIATNACLKSLAKRRGRLAPTSLGPPAQVGEPPAPPVAEVLHLQPYPDALLDTAPDADPAARYALRESIELAFIAAIQHLTPRQRAVLILRDVLGIPASETAELLETTAAAVNSSLQRARAALAGLREPDDAPRALSDEVERSLLRRYVDAWQRADIPGLMALLHEDAVMSMPPSPTWYLGPTAIGAFFGSRPVDGEGIERLRLLETRANGRPALAAYAAGDDGVHRPYGLMVLTIDGEAISAITGFLEQGLFEAFGLPETLAA